MDHNYLFYVDGRSDEETFAFSSYKEGIGIDNNYMLKNNTKVSVISGVETCNHPNWGDVDVVEITTGDIHMYVLAKNIVPLQ